MSVISNIAPAETLISGMGGLTLASASCVASSVITQFLDQVKVTDTSQLINGISNILQKLLRCFNVTEKLTLLYFHHELSFL